MAAPTMVVIFRDADGDEFPVRVPVHAGVDFAGHVAARLVREGEWQPAGELTYDRTETA